MSNERVPEGKPHQSDEEVKTPEENLPDTFPSYERFKSGANNFYLHFASGQYGDWYRKKNMAYEHCLRENPEFAPLAGRLLAKFNETAGDDAKFYALLKDEAYLSELYEAYKMMRPYASSNKELCG